MKSVPPPVSVVMPVFNREKYVQDSIQSILDQTFSDFEFIIIDDGSTDFTIEILESYHDKRIRLVRKRENCGNYTARNEGMKVEINLNDGMVSSYSEQLKMVQEMDGTAEIITKQMRMIYRFINPLRMIFEK